MTLQPIKTFVKGIGTFAAKNSPTILTSCSVAGTIGTAVLAAKAHVKAVKSLENEGPITTKEKFKRVWKYYIPPVVMGTATIACTIGAHSISLKRSAALAGAYAIAETSLKEFKDAAQEIVGEEKVKEIKDKIIDDKIKENPPSPNEVRMLGDDKTLCYDTYSGRYFTSTINDIKTAVNAVNTELFSDLRVSLNDMYYALGLSPVKLGAERGWDFNDAIDRRKDFPIEARFTSHLAEDHTPCLAVEFHPEPDYL